MSFLINPYRHAAGGGPYTNPEPSVFAVDGAWTWFNDPRAIALGDGVLIGAITGAGDLLAYDMQSTSGVDLRGSTFQVDDHANPTFLQRSSDGRILAFASAHAGAAIYTYLSTNPADPTAFGAETSIDASLGLDAYTYPSPIQLTGETNDPIYLFFRAKASGTAHYYYSTSTDQGSTWAAATRLLSNNGASADHSPYVKMVQNGNDRIDFFCTDGHPTFTATNSIYHFYYEGGSFKKTDGTPLTLPIAPATDLAKVYDGTTNRSWLWDCALDGSGNPVCVYTNYLSGTDHRYRRAKWNGSSWDDGEICAAGHYIYVDQGRYSGGVALDPDDVDTVFASREIDGAFRLYRYTYSGSWDAGTQITKDESALRPYVIRGAVEPRLVYFSGPYATYEDFVGTSVKLMDSTAAGVSDTADSNRADVLLHVRGSVIEDVSPSARTLTVGANVTVNGARIALPGATSTAGNGVITAPDSADFTFAGDFTIEIFGAEFDFSSIAHQIVSHWRANTGTRSWQVAYQGDLSPDRLGIYMSSDGTTNTFVDDDWTPTTATPYDLCIERSGTTMRIYVDGAMIHSETFSGSLNNCPGRLVIGSTEASTGLITITAPWDGRFRELRITDVARYANNAGYTVPSLPLPTN